MRRTINALIAAAIISVALALTAGGASACSCGGFTDQQAFDAADTVFLGEFADYEYIQDPDGDGVSASSDPADWAFAVSEVFRGEAYETQELSSAVSGASCGLEIAKTGAFYIFANGGPDTLTAGLCGGTRSANTPLDLSPSVESYAPIVNPSPAVAQPALITDEAPEDEVINQFSGGTFFVVGFIAVGILGAIGAARLAKRARDASDREWRAQDDE
jgi:hypothetical protein